ncbi:MAG: hypothetical protein AABZ08_11675 [Planctomycetota bacterium]
MSSRHRIGFQRGIPIKKLVAISSLVLALACAPGVFSPRRTNLNFNVPVPPLPAVFVDLEGQWTLSGGDGGRSCLVIQESRVSILDLTCSSDGRGFVAAILNSPVISRGGDLITLTLTYRPSNQSDAQGKLTFTGNLQIDGAFVGTRRDEIIDDKYGSSVTPAILSRQ